MLFILPLSIRYLGTVSNFAAFASRTNRSTGGILVEGGTDTTAVFLKYYIKCIATYPEVQRKAQQEIDSVVGPDRIPRIEDMDKLPYIRAVIQEV